MCPTLDNRFVGVRSLLKLLTTPGFQSRTSAESQMLAEQLSLTVSASGFQTQLNYETSYYVELFLQ